MLYEGRSVKSIKAASGWAKLFSEGEAVVVPIEGQGAYVPWVRHGNVLYNFAHLESVTLCPTEEE